MRKQGRGSIPAIKRIRFNGLILSVYSIGWLSYWSHMAAVTLRLWERRKILPEPIFNSLGPYRWYSAREIIEYSNHITLHYQTGRDLKSLKASLRTVNAGIIRQYKELSGSTRSRYDDSYIALPRADAHERAMLAAVKEASEKKAEFFFKKQSKKVGHENSKPVEAVQNHPHQRIGLVGKSSGLAQSDPQALERLQLDGDLLRRRADLRRRRGIN